MILDDLTQVSAAQLAAANNWQDQYRLLMAWGALIQAKPLLRQPELLLKGCETAAWLQHQQVDELHQFFFDSDSRIIKGLAALLLRQVESKTRAEILALDLPGLLQEVGLAKHLTPSRNNGFAALIAQINRSVQG
jgi:cysteine desulfuration protein SufE